MKRSRIIPIFTIFLLFVIPLVIVSGITANTFSNNDVPFEVEYANYLNLTDIALFEYRDKLIEEGKDKSEEFTSIQNKIKMLSQYIIDNKDKIDKARAEADKLDEAKADGTYEAPIWVPSAEPTCSPDPIMIKYGKETNAESLYPDVYHDMNFDCYASASYECVITGSNKITGNAFLTIIDRDTVNYNNQSRYDYIYDSVSQIIITEVLDKEKIMLFTYDGSNKGYVNLETFEVVFSEYSR